MRSSIKVVIAAFTMAVGAASSAQQIQVQVDGQPVYFANTQPQYINGRVLVPLRGVFEQMGATVLWNQQTQTVSAMKSGTDVTLRIGDRMAMINGSAMNLDVPAMVVNGSTMVPIRFVSEALGANVGWFAAQNLVTISTSEAGTIVTPPQTLRRVLLRANEVIPVELDQTLNSANNRRGDTFTATVITTDHEAYGDLPRGTKVEGHIAAIRRRSADRPAILDLTFDRLRFPNGKTVKMDGSLISLDGKFVRDNGSGVLVARENARGADQRMVYAGYGAGAGLLVGVLTKKPLEGAILGGALGYILGQVKKDQAPSTRDVILESGTEMGVRINNNLTANW
jgi:hypothetical protein